MLQLIECSYAIANAKGCNGIIVYIIVFRKILVIQTFHLPEHTPKERVSDTDWEWTSMYKCQMKEARLQDVHYSYALRLTQITLVPRQYPVRMFWEMIWL